MIQEHHEQSDRQHLSPRFIEPSAVIDHYTRSWNDIQCRPKTPKKLYRLKLNMSDALNQENQMTPSSKLTSKTQLSQKYFERPPKSKKSPSASTFPNSSQKNPSNTCLLTAPVRKISPQRELLKSGSVLRPPPPTPECQREVLDLYSLCNQPEFLSNEEDSSMNDRAQLDLIRPLKPRPVPVLRRSQGVPAVGCPCCRKARQSKQ